MLHSLLFTYDLMLKKIIYFEVEVLKNKNITKVVSLEFQIGCL